MALQKVLTEAETLEQYRVALENAELQSVIAAIMAELGYDSATITEGKTLLTQTRAAYDANKTEKDESTAAYAAFAAKKHQIETTYTLHRKKGKVIFRKDEITLAKLALTGTLPKAYIKWLETVKKFYTVASTDKDIQAKLARLKISEQDIAAAQTLITELEAVRAEYIKEKGESQDSTKAKDAALAKIDDWMSEFYAVARIGLEDNPQLLEALNKKVA